MIPIVGLDRMSIALVVSKRLAKRLRTFLPAQGEIVVGIKNQEWRRIAPSVCERGSVLEHLRLGTERRLEQSVRNGELVNPTQRNRSPDVLKRETLRFEI